MKAVAVSGIILAYVGFMILFRFGMPFRVEMGGHIGLSAGINLGEIDRDARYRALGWIGFALVTVGTVMQVAATILS